MKQPWIARETARHRRRRLSFAAQFPRHRRIPGLIGVEID